MVSLLEVIERTPGIINNIIENLDRTFQPMLDSFGQKIDEINEIIFIGSGTSNTSAVTAKYFVEKASGIRATVVFPNEFIYELSVYNPKGLYVFTSQTGTSIVTQEVLAYVKEMGFLTAAISESGDTPVAQAADIYLPMRCGKEEYPMRTIGYSSSVLVQMLLGMVIGRRRGFLSQDDYDNYLAQAKKAAESIPGLIKETMKWTDRSKRSMLRSDCIVFTGVGSLYGLSLEAAVKTWEIPQIVSAGYELEEGVHGPNYGYNHNHCVIVLNSGGYENNKAVALADYMRNEMKNGFLVGVNAVNEKDLSFTPQGGAFCCLEFAVIVQVLAYRLAEDGGRDLYLPHDNSVMESYFKSHSQPI